MNNPRYESERLKELYPGLYYHAITDTAMLHRMDGVRGHYLRLAEWIMDTCPDSKYRTLALTELESSLMRAIQSLAVSDSSALVDPAIPR